MGKPREEVQKHLIRILDADVDSEKSLASGLTKIKGVSFNFSNAICEVLNFDRKMKVGDLSEEQIEKIVKFLQEPKKQGIPSWFLNKQRDYTTGDNIHLTSKDIDFENIQQRRRVNKTKSYKALRLRERLTVRGQRTHSNFRRNKQISARKMAKGGGQQKQ